MPQNLILNTNTTVFVKEKRNSLLKIIHTPDFRLQFLALLLLIGILVVLLLPDVEIEDMTYPLFFGLFLLLILILSMANRKIVAIFEASSKKISIEYGGIYSSDVDASQVEIIYREVRGVGVKKHVNRFGDSFHVFVELKSGEKLDVSGSDLSFAESQLCAETIREFMNIKQRLIAVD